MAVFRQLGLFPGQALEEEAEEEDIGEEEKKKKEEETKMNTGTKTRKVIGICFTVFINDRYML